MAQHGITLLFQARNQMSPELQKLQRQLDQTKKSFRTMEDMELNAGGISSYVKNLRDVKKGTDEISKATEKMKSEIINSTNLSSREIVKTVMEAERLERSLSTVGNTRLSNTVSDANRAETALKQTRSEAQRLDQQRADIEVHADTTHAESQISGLQAMIAGLGATVSAISFGGLSGLMEKPQSYGETLIQAAFKGIDRKAINETMRTLASENPYLSMQQNQDIALYAQKQAKSQNVANPEQFGKEFAKGAANAIIATGKEVEDIKKVQTSLLNQFPKASIQDVNNATISIMSNPDMKGELADTVVEYTPQFLKFSNDMGVLTETFKLIGSMKIWSNDAAFDSIKESGIRLGNTGDLQNLLKTTYESQGLDAKKAQEKAESESKYIQNGLRNGTDEEQRKIMAKLLMDFATIQDPVKRQQAMDALAGGAGENVGKDLSNFLIEFVKLTEKGNIPIADVTKEANKAKLADPNFDVAVAESQKETEKTIAQSSFQDSISEFSIAVDKFATKIYGQISASDGGLIAAAGGGAMGMLGLAGAGVAAGTAGLGLFGLLNNVLIFQGLLQNWKNKVESSEKEVEKREIIKTGRRSAQNIQDLRKRKSQLTRLPVDLGEGPISSQMLINEFDQEIRREKAILNESNTQKRLYQKQHGKKPVEDLNVFERMEKSSTLQKGKGFLNRAGEKVVNFGSSMLEKGSRIPWKKVGAAGTIASAGGILTSLITGDLSGAGEAVVSLLGGAGGGTVGAAIGTAFLPVVGTAIGGLIGSYLGGEGASALWKSVMGQQQQIPEQKAIQENMQNSQAVQNQQIQQNQQVQQNVTIPNISVNVSVDGILQNVEELIAQLNSSSVRSTISNIFTSEISKAINTKAGVPTSVPVPSIRRLGGAME